jgi:hypothetical protein
LSTYEERMATDLSADRDGRFLRVQRLGTDPRPFPCKAQGDDCLLTADWIITDSKDGLSTLACHEHAAGAMWDVWHGPFTPVTEGA